MRSPSLALLALCCAAALTACGSSDDSTTAAPAASAAGEHAGHTTSEANDAGGEHAGHSTGDAAAEGHDHAPGTASDGHDHAHLDIAESGIGTIIKSAGDGYGNLMREAPSDVQPTVALRVKADPAGGWTVRVPTTSFRWAGDDVNTPADAGQGHAHLYVEGKKVARLYGEWAFIPATAGKAGDTLAVVLYADDHSAWAVDGKAVEAEVVLPAVAT